MTDSKIENFSTNVKHMFEIQDRMRAIAAEAKLKRDPLKKQADELEGNIKSYMAEASIDVCNYQDERLELKTVVRFGSLTKKSLEAALVAYFQNEEKAQDCFQSIMTFIGSKELEVLKRLKNRKRKSKAITEDKAQLNENIEHEKAPELSDED
ncbi:MAG: hypothetical protein GY823_03790 [Flavobacteriaceae bacterium]|nr:hypothetical protein [Flavobacteriaceae bacterium]